MEWMYLFIQQVGSSKTAGHVLAASLSFLPKEDLKCGHC